MKIKKRGQMALKNIILVRCSAVFLALIVVGIYFLIMGHNPVQVYVGMVEGAFGKASRIRDTIVIAVPLLITSLGIMIAFKMKFWNIGAEGQILMGAFAASGIALQFGELPGYILLPLMFIASIIGGGLWALIPAYLKTKFNTNESITTLMMNYIAIKWITYLQYGPWKDPKSLGFPKIPNFSESGLLPRFFGLHIGWIIGLVLVIVLYIFFHYSKLGYEVSVVGESQETARYAGMNVKKIMLIALFMSGGIAGIAGMIQASGVNQSLSISIANGYGYTAIITTWLSGLKSSIILPVTLLFAAMIKGGSYIQTAFLIPQAAAQLLQSMILFFILGSEFFIQYQIVLKQPFNKGVRQ